MAEPLMTSLKFKLGPSLKLYVLVLAGVYWSFCPLYAAGTGAAVLMVVGLIRVKNKRLPIATLVIIAAFSIWIALLSGLAGQTFLLVLETGLRFLVRALTIVLLFLPLSGEVIRQSTAWLHLVLRPAAAQTLTLLIRESVWFLSQIARQYYAYWQRLHVRGISVLRSPLRWISLMSYGFLAECIGQAAVRASEIQYRQELEEPRPSLPGSKPASPQKGSIGQWLFAGVVTILAIVSLVWVPDFKSFP